MNKKRQIKQLKRQNKLLRNRISILSEKIPSESYKKKIDRSVNKLNEINDEILDLYSDLCVCKSKEHKIYQKYKIRTFIIKLKQKIKI